MFITQKERHVMSDDVGSDLTSCEVLISRHNNYTTSLNSFKVRVSPRTGFNGLREWGKFLYCFWTNEWFRSVLIKEIQIVWFAASGEHRVADGTKEQANRVAACANQSAEAATHRRDEALEHTVRGEWGAQEATQHCTRALQRNRGNLPGQSFRRPL